MDQAARNGEPALAGAVPDLDGGEFSAWTGISTDEFGQVGERLRCRRGCIFLRSNRLILPRCYSYAV